MRAREFIIESTEREIAQAQYMQGECAVLALTIRNMNPQRFTLGFVYEFFDSSPDMYLEPDEFDELDPARQQDIQYNHENWTLTHAYVYDVLTREYIDAEGRHKQLPMIGRSFNSTRHNKFPAETQDLVNVSHYMEYDEAQEKWIVLQGWAALEKAYTPENKQRAREYAIKYLGIDQPAQAVAEDSEHYNGIELSMEIEKDDEYVDDDDYDNQTLYVRATSGGRELGHVLFSFDGEYLLPQDLEVEERYRGQGIAQTMYDFVKSKGYKIRRSGQQTDAGAGFWHKHRPEKNVWEDLNEADASAVKFQTASTDNYQSSFTVTAIADGKNVGHFSFFRDPETDDVHNQAEVTDNVRGKGYGKALLLKAIEVANDHGLGFQEDSQSLSRAQSRVYDSLYDAGWIVDADGYWFLTPEGQQELSRLSTAQQGMAENFADGRHPEDKGDSKRYHVPTKSSVSNLRKFAKNHSGRAAQLAHWAANMKAGRAKKKTNETIIGNLHFPQLTVAIDDHAVDRTRTRGISPAAIDQSLKKLSSIADQLAQMEVNNTVWVYDVANNLGMGLRRISSQNMLFKLKTVVGARPYDGAIPIIELS